MNTFRSLHTNGFANILRDLGISLAVSTYQAGKLILIRELEGICNTHFRPFNSPMGIAVNGNRLAIGTASEIWTYHWSEERNSYIPINIYVTGDIRGHDLVWSQNEIWCVNTKFSCLSTINPLYSFVPEWYPPFITELRPEDRCHINGLCVVNDLPTYITLLGETNEPNGWRENKRDGGLVMNVQNNNVLAHGLSMPHSPRWHQEKLWLLESGKGSIGYLDNGYTHICKLPGFTRGLDFMGNLAFVGVSQVRESSTFAGLDITKNTNRCCGVGIVDIKLGEVVAWIHFEEDVEEIFAVQIIPHRMPDLEYDNGIVNNTYILP